LEHLSVLTEKSSENSLKEILKELGPAPPQLPRKDNANVELLLVNRFKGSDSTETKEMKPEQIYTETKISIVYYNQSSSTFCFCRG